MIRRSAHAFISYSHHDRAHGGKAKEILSSVGISAFLAHEDLEVTDEWRDRILDELRRCDLFVPLLSANFLASRWASQEAGFIVSRPEVTIAPLSLDGTRSFGFLSHIQSPLVGPDGITMKILVEPLAARLPRQILPALIRIVGKAGSFRHAEETMLPLLPHFGILTPEEAQAFAEVVVANGQVWSADLCRREYLPQFIEAQRSQINEATLRALEYQVQHDRGYRGEVEPDA